MALYTELRYSVAETEKILGRSTNILVDKVADGEILELFRINISSQEQLQNFIKERGEHPAWLSISNEEDNSVLSTFALLYNEEKGFYITTGGFGGMTEDKSKILQLDVKNNNVDKIYEMDFQQSIEAKSSEVFETIIFPNESCIVNLSVVYIYDGSKELSSEISKNLEMAIYVPLYDINGRHMVDEQRFLTIYRYFEENARSSYKYGEDPIFQRMIEYDGEDFELVKDNAPL